MHSTTRLLTLQDIEHFINWLRSLPYRDITIRSITYLAYIMAAWIILVVIFKIIIIFRHIKEKYVLLEITPPQETKIATTSTTQLFSIIAGLLEHRSLIDKLLLKQTSSSFEIVSQKEGQFELVASIGGVPLEKTMKVTFRN